MGREENTEKGAENAVKKNKGASERLMAKPGSRIRISHGEGLLLFA